MSDLRYQMVIDLAGNLQATARRYGRALGQFSESGEKNLTRLQRVAGGLDRGLEALGNRYMGLATGATAAAAVKFVGDLDARVRDLAGDAGRSVAEMEKLKQKIFEVAQERDIRLDPGVLFAGVEQVVGSTGNIDFAVDNLRNIGLAIRGISADGKDVGKVLSAAFNQAKVRSAEDLMKALDTLLIQGKDGEVAFKQLAGELASVSGYYSSLNREGTTVLREIGALQQTVFGLTQSAPETTTAISAAIREIQSSKMRKTLESGGIQLFEDDGETWRALPDLVKDIVRRVEGETSKLQDLGFGEEAMKVFTATANQFDKETGGFGKLDHLLGINGDGSTIRADAAMKADSFNAASQNLLTAAQRFADANLSGPVQALADAMNGLTPEMQNLAMWGAVGTVGTAIGYVGAKRVGGMLGLGRKGRVAGGAADIAAGLPAAGGPMPVTVTNWPPRMYGSPGDRTRRNRSAAVGRTAAATGASAVASRAAGVGGRWLRRVPYLGMGLMAADAGMRLANGDMAGAVETGASAGGFWAGAAGGAAVGGAVGSVVPLVGTTIGAGVGGLAGGIAGSELGAWLGREAVDIWDDWFGSKELPTQKVEVDLRVESDRPVRVGRLHTGDRAEGIADVNVDVGPLMGMP